MHEPPQQHTYGLNNQMTYIDKSDLHAFTPDPATPKSASDSQKKKSKTMYEKQQIVMSEAVMEGKGDKDDSDINLPADLNDSSMSSSIVSPDNNPNQEKQPSIQEHVLKHCKFLPAIFSDLFSKRSDRIQ